MADDRKNWRGLPEHAIASRSTMDASTVAHVMASKLPGWVKEEIAEHPYFAGFGLLTDLLNAPELLWVWESIGRAIYPNEFSSSLPFPRLNLVDCAVRAGLSPLESYETLTGQQRAKKAKRIAALADELAGESELLVGKSDGIYPEGPVMRSGMFSYFSLDTTYEFLDASGLVSNDPETNEKAAFFQSLSDDGKETFIDILRSAYWFAAKRTPELLGAIAQGIEMWGGEEQKLYRPNDPNAQRLLFIRRVTSMFVMEFGRPFREETLALTAHYFSVDDLDAASLSRLAPVPKVRPKRFHAAVPNDDEG